MKRIYILIIVLFFSIGSYSQNKSVFGYVYDKNTGDVLVGASIIDKAKNNGAVSDNNGFFHISTSELESREYEISFIGYESLKFIMKPEDKPFLINLRSQNIDLDEVTVVANIHRNDIMGKLNIPVNKIREIPMLSGETDIIRAFQLLPGIQSGDEGSSSLLVRGGSHDQNLFLMDNTPLYYVNHLGGFTSVFDFDAINDVSIYKGGFPAQFGGRLSSIMNIGLKNGNKYETKKSLSVGLLSTKFFMEGPLKNNKTTYLFSTRICNAGLILQAVNLLKNDGYKDGYNFYDFTGKISHQIDDKNILYLSLYGGLDALSTKIKSNRDISTSGKDSHKWGNAMTNVRWYHQYNPRLISNTIVAYSRFFNNNSSNSEHNVDDNTVKSNSVNKSLINDVIAKTDFSYYLKDNQQLKFGADLTLHTFSPFSSGYEYSSSIEKTDTLISTKVNAVNADFYLSGNFNLLDKFNVQPGFRFSSWISNDKSYFYPEPRFLLSYKVDRNMKLSASYSHMLQYVHLLTNQSNTIPDDLWIPTTQKLSPERSNQYSVGMEYRLPLNTLFNVEAFYKSIDNIVEYEESLFSNKRANWQDGITSGGKGKSKGVEFLLKKEGGIFDGWISYTLSKTTRQFDNINNGKEYPFKFDHRHDLNVVCNFHLNKKMTISSVWVFNGGNNITMPVEKYYIYTPEPYDPIGVYNPTTDEYGYYLKKEMKMFNYNGKNGYRTPAYHRLDIGLTYEKSPSSSWYFGLYNAYNRLNAYYYYCSDDGTWKKYSLFPIIPSVSYTYKF